jgi:hypothetical protein
LEPGHLHIISYLSARSLGAQNPSGMMGNSEGIPRIILDLMFGTVVGGLEMHQDMN